MIDVYCMFIFAMFAEMKDIYLYFFLLSAYLHIKNVLVQSSYRDIRCADKIIQFTFSLGVELIAENISLMRYFRWPLILLKYVWFTMIRLAIRIAGLGPMCRTTVVGIIE